MAFQKKGSVKTGRSASKSSGNKKAGSSLNTECWLVWLLFLALFFIFLSIFGDNGLLKIGELKRVRMALTEEITALREENDALRNEIIGLKEDPFFIEKVAREELGLVRPQEVVYHFVWSGEGAGKGN